MAKLKKSRAGIATEYLTKVLPAQKMLELDLLMRRRVTTPRIVDIIQKEWGYFASLSSVYLIKRISEYHKYVFKEKVFKEGPEREEEIKTIFEITDKIDVLKEVGVLVLKQKARADRALQLEASFKDDKSNHYGLLFKDITANARKEVKLLGDLLEKMANLHMETGHLTRAPKTLQGEVAVDEKDPTKMNFKVTERFEQALKNIEERFGKAASEELDVVMVPVATDA